MMWHQDNYAERYEYFADVRMSISRCEIRDGFLDRFYEILIGSHPEIPGYFKNTNMVRQAEALKDMMQIAVYYVSGNDFALRKLDLVRNSHGPDGQWKVQPHLYQHWLESFIQAVSEFDSRFNSELEQKWREALSAIIHFIKSEWTEKVTDSVPE